MAAGHNSPVGQDAGAVAHKGCKYVTAKGNKNIVFTIITGPEQDKRANRWYLHAGINVWAKSGS